MSEDELLKCPHCGQEPPGCWVCHDQTCDAKEDK